MLSALSTLSEKRKTFSESTRTVLFSGQHIGNVRRHGFDAQVIEKGILSLVRLQCVIDQ